MQALQLGVLQHAVAERGALALMLQDFLLFYPAALTEVKAGGIQGQTGARNVRQSCHAVQ
jgi:hypothetical protein